jgi:hypothetical protein
MFLLYIALQPYFSKKSCGTQSKIILQDNDKIVTKNVDVAEVSNKVLTCASLSLFGKIPESIDMFIIFVIGDKSDILTSFINLTEISSTPVAFLTLNLSMTYQTMMNTTDPIFINKRSVHCLLYADDVIPLASLQHSYQKNL